MKLEIIQSQKQADGISECGENLCFEEDVEVFCFMRVAFDCLLDAKFCLVNYSFLRSSNETLYLLLV